VPTTASDRAIEGRGIVPDVAAAAEVAAGEPTTGGSRRSVLFLAGSLSGGNLVAMALRLVGGVLLGRLVAPSTLGLFAGIGLVVGYASVAQLGILNGVNRELPYHIGRGDRARAYELAAAGQAWALAIGGVVSVCLLVVATWHLFRGDLQLAAGWAANAVLAMFTFYGNNGYLFITFRTSSEFVRLAWVNVVEAATGMATLILVAAFGFYGLCLRVILSGAASTALLFRWRPVRVRPHWSRSDLRHLFVIGLPIFVVGQAYTLWTGVINLTLVLNFTGTEGLGLYAMVGLGITALEVVPAALTQVLYPRMAQEYGAGRDVRHLVRISIKPMLATAAALAVVAAVGWFTVEPVVRILIPQYVAAVPAMQWALLLPVVSSFQPVTSIFNVVGRQDMYLAALGCGIAAYVVALMVLRPDAHLTAFPLAMLVGRTVMTIVGYLFVARLQRRDAVRQPAS
jgi:O-antigen/teichoic acid export membrane protein